MGRRWVALIGLPCAVVMPVIAYAAPYWPVSADTAQARSISFLFWFIMAIAAVFLFGVLGVLLFMAVRFRGRPGQPDPLPRHGNNTLEFWWTAVPTLLLAVVFAFTVVAAQQEIAIASDALDITVIGHQWWWEFHYPGDVVTANELHVPAGRQVRLLLQSADVVHNFWVPQLAGKEELIPGQDNVWTFTAEHPAVYDGSCSEFCGTQHGWMRLRVIADTPQEFDHWLATNKQPASTPVENPQTSAALKVYVANACGACHTIQGVSNGKVGPDLTHVGSRGTIGAGVLRNTPENMSRWLGDPQQFKPGSFMPNFHLTGGQAQSLATYLEALQ